MGNTASLTLTYSFVLVDWHPVFLTIQINLGEIFYLPSRGNLSYICHSEHVKTFFPYHYEYKEGKQRFDEKLY